MSSPNVPPDGNPPQGGGPSQSQDNEGRGGRRGKGRRNQQKKLHVPKTTKFEGKCEELKGHVYDCADSRQADQYSRTTKEVAEYAGRTLKYPQDIRKAIETLQNPTWQESADPPANASRAQERIWE